MNSESKNRIGLRTAGLIVGVSLTAMTILSALIFPSLKNSPAHMSGILIIIMLDLVIAWGLYVLLEPVNKDLSLLMSIFRIVFASVFAVALSQLGTPESFYLIWDIALALIGIHLIILGYLAYKSGFLPRILGILVLVAGIGYAVDTFLKFFGVGFTISTFTFVGEVLFGLWLLFMWRKIPSRESLVNSKKVF